MTKKTATTAQGYHYYATIAFGWAVAPTREEAIASVARQAGTDIIKRNVKAHGGLYCWSCRVELPQEAHYSINFYQPEFITRDGKTTEERVPLSKVIEANIQNLKGHLVIVDKEPK